MTWRPLLEETHPARAAVRDLAGALASSEPTTASLGGGAAGIAVFLAYYAQAFDDPQIEEAASSMLERAIAGLSTRLVSESLYGGFCGVGWAIDHLTGDPTDDDANTAIDDVLAIRLARVPFDGEFDLIVGLAGVAIYALERLPRPSAVLQLEQVVAQLARSCERGAHGATWFSPPAWLPPHQLVVAPTGHYNVGAAHGVPGVIAVLARIVAAGIGGAVARALLDDAVRWLLAQQLPERAGSRFPSWVTRERGPEPARSAWCYGDPGVAIALLSAARAVGEPTWEAAAVEHARHLARRAFDECRVKDAGLCHGAFGLAHILARFYSATGDTELGAGAVAWYERGLAMRRPGEGVAGFVSYEPDDRGQPAWGADPGLLAGAAGIGLALLAALTTVEPRWDRVLLAST